METLEGWAFVLVALGVPLVPLLWLAVRSSSIQAAHQSVMTWLAAVAGALIVAHWVVWWFSFDAYLGETYPNGLFPVSTVLMYLGAGGVAAVVMGAVVAALAAAKRRKEVAF